VGLTSIDPAILEAAEAMGMTEDQILFRVRLPLATSFILAGIRTATVITIGVATIAAAIGAGGLGTFIFRGVAMVSDAVILAGATHRREHRHCSTAQVKPRRHIACTKGDAQRRR